MEKELQIFLTAYALKAALEAGKKIMRIYESDESYNVNLKSDNTLIIDADKVSHDTIRRTLAVTRIPLLSEEGRNILFEERYGWDLYWLVDPLDGTLEFVRRKNEFAVSIALMSENEPAIGVVLAPVFKQLYFAVKGCGTFRIDNIDLSDEASYDIDQLISSAVRLECQKEFSGDELTILTSLSHPNAETDRVLSRFDQLYETVNKVPCGSVLKFCRMAEGVAHLYFRTTALSDWDTAAGEIIARESGLRVSNLQGEPLKYNQQELIIEPFKVCFTEFPILGYDN